MWPRKCSTMATDVTLAVLHSFGSICIKAVASKIMHYIYSIHVQFTLPSDMLLSKWMKFDSIHAVIDSSHSF